MLIGAYIWRKRKEAKKKAEMARLKEENDQSDGPIQAGQTPGATPPPPSQQRVPPHHLTQAPVKHTTGDGYGNSQVHSDGDYGGGQNDGRGYGEIQNGGTYATKQGYSGGDANSQGYGSVALPPGSNQKYIGR